MPKILIMRPLPSPNSRMCQQSSLSGALLLAFVCMSSFLMLSTPARAQGQSKPEHQEWEASFFYGGSFLGSGTYATPVEGSSTSTSRNVELKYASGYLMGASITNNRGQRYGGAFEYSFANQPMTFTNLADSIPSLSFGQSVHRFAYNLIYYPMERQKQLRPYVFAGPGVALFAVKGSSKDAAAVQGVHLNDPWKMTMNWGGGIKYLVMKQAGIQFQFSDSISGVPGYGLPETAKAGPGGANAGFRPDGLMNNWQVSIGFNYQWRNR